MKAQIINQHVGQSTGRDALRVLLGDQSLTRLRLLVAFCRGSGVGLLTDDLQGFIRRGGSVEVIVGLDLGGTTPEALEALLELGAQCFAFGVKGDRVFHPKVALFDDGRERKYTALIGSNNWTVGGLDSNFETSVRLDLEPRAADDRRFIAELEALWRTYREPQPPLGSGNLRRLTRRFVRDLAERLPAEHRSAPDEESSRIVDELFPSVVAPRAPVVRARRRGPRRTSTRVRKPGLPRHLYLEVTGPETGQGREIQLPLDALPEYFGIQRDDVLFLTFAHPGGTTERRPLASYANSTFRISSARFRDITLRPVIVHLERTDCRNPDRFKVEIIPHGSRQFRRVEPLLTRGGIRGKRWGYA